MSGERKATGVPLDELLQALSLAPDARADVAPQPDAGPGTLLDQVLRAHPALTRAQAIADILESGGDPFTELRAIDAWRRSGQPAYARIPSRSDPEKPS